MKRPLVFPTIYYPRNSNTVEMKYDRNFITVVLHKFHTDPNKVLEVLLLTFYLSVSLYFLTEPSRDSVQLRALDGKAIDADKRS